MKTRATLGGVLASLVVLIVGWQAGASALTAATSGTTVTTGQTGGTGTTSSPGTPGTSGTSGASGTSGSGGTDGTYTGSSVRTRFGDVQVQVTIAAGAISDVQALHLTNSDGRSVQISNRAAPMVRDEVLSAQSTHVSNIGGATYTTQAYLQSVQSALDQAGF